MRVSWGGFCGSKPSRGRVIGYAVALDKGRTPLLVIAKDEGGERILPFYEVSEEEDTEGNEFPIEKFPQEVQLAIEEWGQAIDAWEPKPEEEEKEEDR